MDQISLRTLRSEFLSVAARNPSAFTDWQIVFCRTCSDRIMSGRPLTDKQLRVLGTGLLYRLWANDPDLWE